MIYKLSNRRIKRNRQTLTNWENQLLIRQRNQLNRLKIQELQQDVSIVHHHVKPKLRLSVKIQNLHLPEDQKKKSKVNPKTGIIEIKSLHPYIPINLPKKIKKVKPYRTKLEGLNCKQRREERYRIKHKEDETQRKNTNIS